MQVTKTKAVAQIGEHIGQELGIKTASEVFADRNYEDDGSLTPRKNYDALIEEEDEVLNRVLQMVNSGIVTTTSGKSIPIVAETVCIHSDGKNALKLARALYNGLLKNSQSIIH